MGLYEPTIVLTILGAIYAGSQLLPTKAKRRVLFMALALLLVIGACGVVYDLLTHGTLTSAGE